MKLTQTISIAALALFAAAASAQSLKVATGGPTGTYSKMLKEIGATCGSSVAMAEQPSSGSIENVNLIVGNQVNAAFVQSDVLHYRSQTEDLGGIKTLLALHPEEVHVLVLDAGAKEPGMLSKIGIGDKAVNYNSVKDLAGKTVGAAGGSFITAQVIRLQSEIGFKVVEVPDNKTLVAALMSKQIDAALMVGGAPLGPVAELKGGYKLLTFPDDVAAKLKAVYRPARLNYTGINARGVATIATDALFVTREYKTAKFVEALGALRGCVLTNLDEFKEATGMHPKWQAVDGSNKGKWPYYELPAAAAPVRAAEAPAPAPKKK